MWSRFILCLAVISLLIFWACDSKQTATTANSADNDTLRYKTALEVEPLLQNVDSVQLLFYTDPDGDSLRYSRFYSYRNTRDSQVGRIITKALQQPVEERKEVKSCRSEGKMYLLSKNETVKTVYFSTRCDSCCFLYFIKDGNFYYLPLSDEVKTTLQTQKSLATLEKS